MKCYHSEKLKQQDKQAVTNCPVYSMAFGDLKPELFSVDFYEINNLPENISG